MTILASDKTGTLTQNKMEVKLLLTMESTMDGKDLLQKDENLDKVNPFIKSVMEVSLFCNQAKFDDSPENASETNTNISDEKSSKICGVSKTIYFYFIYQHYRVMEWIEHY